MQETVQLVDGVEEVIALVEAEGSWFLFAISLLQPARDDLAALEAYAHMLQEASSSLSLVLHHK